MTDDATAGMTAATDYGPVHYFDDGSGVPVLCVHGSPGGSDQGRLIGAFLVARGFRVISPSRPGYHGTALTDDNARPDQQAAMELALMEGLGIDRFAVACWSGGGPSSYALVARHPERVTALAAIAALSGPYTWDHPHRESLLAGAFGGRLMKELSRRAPKYLVKQLVSAEGDLSKQQRNELVESIWADEAKRAWVLALMASIAGDRRDGLHNDQQHFATLTDLGLADIRTPTLLVHATTDADVPFSHSERAAATISGAQLVRIDGGTHVSLWTDPSSDDLQRQVATHLAGP